MKERGHLDEARRRLAHNPFHVLGLETDCSRAEVEREGQKLLAMLDLELAGAARYRSPLGEQLRTPELVREAMAALRDPDRRLVHEIWASSILGSPSEAPTEPEPSAEPEPTPDLGPFAALGILGFGERSRG